MSLALGGRYRGIFRTFRRRRRGNELEKELADVLQSFQDDLEFLESHTSVVLLTHGRSAVAIAPAYQGRVMTSTFDRDAGPSFGWINRPVVATGIVPEKQRAGTLEEHIHVFGGEERFWLGPEGGQFGLYFEPGAAFEFSQWKTPAAIDTAAFEVVEQSDASAVFSHACTLRNFHGTEFTTTITRSIRILDRTSIAEALQGDELPSSVRAVAYESDNRLTNCGEKAWVPDSGLLSIWLLGMYNPTPQTTVVVPFHAGETPTLGPKVNDSYFGQIPGEFLKVKEDVLFFKGDGTRRGKIGLSPQRSKGVAGSYDSQGQLLTIVTYDPQDAPHGYVNSMWEIQEQPYAGDAINAYNDGPPVPGEPRMGPFYELETSSPAAALAPGETMRHVQRTFHLQGEADQLNSIAERMLGVCLRDVAAAF